MAIVEFIVNLFLGYVGGALTGGVDAFLEFLAGILSFDFLA